MHRSAHFVEVSDPVPWPPLKFSDLRTAAGGFRGQRRFALAAAQVKQPTCAGLNAQFRLLSPWSLRRLFWEQRCWSGGFHDTERALGRGDQR